MKTLSSTVQTAIERELKQLRKDMQQVLGLLRQQRRPEGAAAQEEDYYLSLQEAARRLQLSTSKLSRLIRQGEIPARNVGGRLRPTYRISWRELKAWVDRPVSGTPMPRSRHH